MEGIKNNHKNKNMKAIEKLSDELEQLYKELEIYQKENIVLENFLKRMKEKTGQDRIDDDFIEGELSLDKKYEIALSEEEHLKKCIEEGKQKSEAMMDTLKALLEESDIAMKELRKEAIDFQRNIIEEAENVKTNRIDAGKLVRYRQKKAKEKEGNIQKMDVKMTALKSKLSKLNSKVKKKDFGNEDLKFIDFHQLQIENKTFLGELDKKNVILQELKVKTTDIMETLLKIKKELKKQTQLKLRYNKNITDKQNQIEAVKEEMKDISNSITHTTRINGKLSLQKSKMDDNKNFKMKIKNFISDKELEKSLKNDIKNLLRKQEVIQAKYEESVKVLEKNDVNVEAI